MIEKASSVATYGGAGGAVVSGAAEYLGLTPGEWQIVGVIVGIGIGIAGLMLNTLFQWLRYRRGD